jgi:hypothetical protein
MEVIKIYSLYNLSVKLSYSLRMLFIRFKFIKIYLRF